MKTSIAVKGTRFLGRYVVKVIMLIGAALFFASLHCNAQNNGYADDGLSEDGKPPDFYTASVGISAYPMALSARFRTKHDALEGFAAVTPHWNRLTLLYELNKTLQVRGLYIFGGIGMHFTEWKQNWKTEHFYYGSDAAMGIDGIIGIDYKLHSLPIAISADWQPVFANLYGYKNTQLLNGGISVRYTFR